MVLGLSGGREGGRKGAHLPRNKEGREGESGQISSSLRLVIYPLFSPRKSEREKEDEKDEEEGWHWQTSPSLSFLFYFSV